MAVVTVPTARWVGGIRRNGIVATRGLAELSMDDSGVRLRLRNGVLRALFGWLIPETLVQWDHLLVVKAVRTAFPGAVGLSFRRTHDHRGDELFFGCSPLVQKAVIAELRNHGVEVRDGGRVWW